MQKKLIALAVASAFAAPAFAATSNVDVYGIISIALEDTDGHNSELAVIDRVSRVGVKGSEDLGGGLSAIWQVETQLSSTGADGVGGTQSWANRNTFVGLKSNSFGTVLAGRHDTPYKIATGSLDPFADTAADYNLGGIKLTGTSAAGATASGSLGYVNAQHDLRSPSAIAWISPSWSGLTLAVAGVATNTGIDNNDTFDAVSAAAMYSNGPLFASLAYQKANNAGAAVGISSFKFATTITSTTASGTFGDDVNMVLDDTAAWKLGLGYTFGNTTVAGIYEKVSIGCSATYNNSKIGCGDLDIRNWMLNVNHKMGNITLKAAYGRSDLDDMNMEARQWSLGVDYALSKRTNVYAVFHDNESDSFAASGTSGALATVGNNDLRTIGIGLKHSF